MPTQEDRSKTAPDEEREARLRETVGGKREMRELKRGGESERERAKERERERLHSVKHSQLLSILHQASVFSAVTWLL